MALVGIDQVKLRLEELDEEHGQGLQKHREMITKVNDMYEQSKMEYQETLKHINGLKRVIMTLTEWKKVDQDEDDAGVEVNVGGNSQGKGEKKTAGDAGETRKRNKRGRKKRPGKNKGEL